MILLEDICGYLEQYAPAILAEEWDNVGLLAGDPAAPLERVMTCLTITPQTAREAVEQRADLVVSHHPLPFRAVKRLVTTSTPGRLLWTLLTHEIAIHSPHTAFDSAATGINQLLAESLHLQNIVPLVPNDQAPHGLGAGRCGILSRSVPLREIAERLRSFLRIQRLQYVGDLDSPITQVAVACGAAGEFLTAAQLAGCQLLVLGETNLHTCLEAEATNVSLLLLGHFASERFAVEHLAAALADAFPTLTVWPSVVEADPVRWL